MHIQAIVKLHTHRQAQRFILCLIVLSLLLLPLVHVTGQDEPDAVRITGTITNGTEGSSVPDNLPVSLRIVESGTLLEVGQFTTISRDGSYELADIPYVIDGIYFVTTTYLGRDFAALFQITDDESSKDVPLVIYEITNDPAAISIDSIITEISGVGDVLEMRLELLITNTSDRMFTSGKTLADGRPIALEIPLPPASVLTSDSLGRYVFDEATYTVYDTRALLPGIEQPIKLVFLVPYSQTAIIDYLLPYQLAGQVIVILNNDELTLVSDQLPELDEETTGIAAKSYASNFNRTAGEVVSFEIRGNIPQPTSEVAESANTESSNLLPILLGGVVILATLIAGSFWLMRRSSANPSTNSLIDGLTYQIQTLDADHDAGRINHDVYRNKRAELEVRIQTLLERKDNS